MSIYERNLGGKNRVSNLKEWILNLNSGIHGETKTINDLCTKKIVERYGEIDVASIIKKWELIVCPNGEHSLKIMKESDFFTIDGCTKRVNR